MTRATVKSQAAIVAELESEHAGLLQLVEPQRANLATISRDHRAGKADAAALESAHGSLRAVEYALGQVAAELEDARATLAELESAAADEILLAEIAAGTVAHRAAEAAHWQLLEDVQQVVARGIVKSEELMRTSSAAKTRAKDAALRLAQRHGRDVGAGGYPTAEYARAVNGSDVAPLNGQETVLRWPGHGRFRLLRDIPDSIMGVQIRADEA
jgi:hypothetical protein